MKICPECGAKNFDDSKYCMKCTANIKNAELQPYKAIISKEDDDYPFYTPRGYVANSSIRNYFTLPGIFFGIISFFFIPILFVILAFVFGSRAAFKGDSYGYIAVLLAIISLAIHLILPLSGMISIMPF